MFRTGINCSKAYLNSAASRFLFTHAKRNGATELVMTNNAGIFGAYWSLNHHAHREHPDVHIVCFPFWLDRIAHQHKFNPWGQTLLGFPTIVRAIFRRIYPNYPLDKVVTWEMMQELRKFTVNELKSMDRVTLHDFRDEPFPIDYHGLFEMTQGANIQLRYKDKTIVTVPTHTEIYNWVKIPRLHRLKFLPERPHTVLYTLPPEKVPDPILVMGDGLSVVWLQRDFPNHRVIAIVSDRNAELLEVPANSVVNYKKIQKITVDDIRHADENQIIIRLSDNSTLEIPQSNYVSAIGYIPYADLTRKIPDNQKTERCDIPANSWVAPKNIPVGSLTQSLIKFFEETENLDNTFELQFHHSPTIVEVLRSRFRNEFRIELKEVFFDKLKHNISGINDALDVTEELNLFVSTFKDSQNPSVMEVRLFENAISLIQNEKNLQISDSAASSFKGLTDIIKAPILSKRFFSSLAHVDKLSGLSQEQKSSVQKLISIFLHPDRKAVEAFDNKQKERYALTEEDRDKMKNVLAEAKKSQKTFSAY